jgi:hypothetical protein
MALSTYAHTHKETSQRDEYARWGRIIREKGIKSE